MNSRVRLQAAMSLQAPDRVPLMCQLSIGHMLQNLNVSPVEFWHDQAAYAEGLLDLRRTYDFDGILVSLHGHDPLWSLRVASRRMTQEGEEVLWDNGDRTFYPLDDLPRHYPAKRTWVPELSAIGPGHLPQVLGYLPVSLGLHFALHPDHRFDIFRSLRKEVGSAVSIHGEVTSPFDYYLDLLGQSDGLIGLIEYPRQAKMILDHFASLVAQLAYEMCNEGVDAVKISSPFAGAGFLSTGMYREFVLPYEREVVQAVRSRNVHAYSHTCGAIADRLELMLSAGVSGIECLDPPPLGNIDLADAKARIGGRGFIKGNIDPVNTLLFGTRDQILADARRRLDIGKEGGGFILSTACSVAPRVPRDNVLILREAVDRWG